MLSLNSNCRCLQATETKPLSIYNLKPNFVGLEIGRNWAISVRRLKPTAISILRLKQTDDPTMRYFDKEDILHIAMGEGQEVRSVELGPNITVEIDQDNQLIGIEILNASNFMRDAVLDSVQARTLQLLEAAPV